MSSPPAQPLARLADLSGIPAGTAVCGIVLHPAGHTRSPAMHRAAFTACGVDAVYLAFDIEPADLADAIAVLRDRPIRQLSVSIPHKREVMAHLDEIDPTARAIGAVNTVVYRDGALWGSNTDWLGAVLALERETELAGRRAVVLGAGGTARAVVYGLHQRGARVAVLNRTETTARALADELSAESCGPLTRLADIPCEVLVNTTSVGLDGDASPVPADAIPPDSVVMDAVYSPPRTRLLADAEARGARTVGGKWMLIHQAALQFTAWTDLDAPIDAMERAFDAAGS